MHPQKNSQQTKKKINFKSLSFNTKNNENFPSNSQSVYVSSSKNSCDSEENSIKSLEINNKEAKVFQPNVNSQQQIAQSINLQDNKPIIRYPTNFPQSNINDPMNLFLPTTPQIQWQVQSPNPLNMMNFQNNFNYVSPELNHPLYTNNFVLNKSAPINYFYMNSYNNVQTHQNLICLIVPNDYDRIQRNGIGRNFIF